MPPAPALFSTYTGWPSGPCMASATSRATMSVEPAAANGTTSLTGLCGNSWAQAGAVPATHASMPVITAHHPRQRPLAPNLQHAAFSPDTDTDS